MSFRRLAPAELQPNDFSFSPENSARLDKETQKYPLGRQASAVIAALWIGQEQEGWVTRPMVEAVAKRLDMAFIRVLEVATFYTMFNLEPVGQHLVQVCTTTPCWLQGSDHVIAACKKHIAPSPQTLSADGKFSWMEVECLGACVNAPVLQIGKDYYEDLDGPITVAIIEALRGGQTPTPGPQNGRHSSEPFAGPTTLQGETKLSGSETKTSGPSTPRHEAPAVKPPGAAG